MDKNLRTTPKFNLRPNIIKNCVVFVAFSSILLTSNTIFADNSGPRNIVTSKAIQAQKPVGGDLAKLNAEARVKFKSVTLKNQVSNSVKFVWSTLNYQNQSYYDAYVYPGYYQEKDSPEYYNYCGPTSTQVALSVRLPSDQIPSAEAIARAEHLNSYGVYMENIVPILNQVLDSNFYMLHYPSSQEDFWDRVVYDINNGYATVFGVKTTEDMDWKPGIAHIITAVGYYDASDEHQNEDRWILYVDTASKGSGNFHGNYYKWLRLDALWRGVHQNAVMAW